MDKGFNFGKRSTPNARNFIFKYGMQTAQPFEISDTVGKDGNPNFKAIDEYLGEARLSSIAIEYSGQTLEFEECILTVSQEKNIVTTPLQGRNGTVKEFISKGDYNIALEIGISNYQKSSNDQSSFEYPKEAINEFINILNVDDTIALQSDFLLLFGVESAVVLSYNLIQETHSNRQAFQVQMLSDRPYEIQLNEN